MVDDNIKRLFARACEVDIDYIPITIDKLLPLFFKYTKKYNIEWCISNGTVTKFEITLMRFDSDENLGTYVSVEEDKLRDAILVVVASSWGQIWEATKDNVINLKDRRKDDNSN